MTALLGSGVLIMIAADAIVGVRLLVLAARTRELPELLLGSSFVLMGVVGYPLSIVARRGLFAEGTSDALLTGALAAQDLACLAIYVVTWRVFRPGARAATALPLAAAAAFAASLAGGLGVGPDAGGFYYLGLGARAVGFAWCSLESLRYAALLRRRLRIGLADPVVADRFRLWGLANTAILAGFAVFLFGRLTGPNVAESPLVLGATSLIGIAAGTAIWLAFVPPAAYVRRIAARAPVEGPPG